MMGQKVRLMRQSTENSQTGLSCQKATITLITTLYNSVKQNSMSEYTICPNFWQRHRLTKTGPLNTEKTFWCQQNDSMDTACLVSTVQAGGGDLIK